MNFAQTWLPTTAQRWQKNLSERSVTAIASSSRGHRTIAWQRQICAEIEGVCKNAAAFALFERNIDIDNPTRLTNLIEVWLPHTTQQLRWPACRYQSQWVTLREQLLRFRHAHPEVCARDLQRLYNAATLLQAQYWRATTDPKRRIHVIAWIAHRIQR